MKNLKVILQNELLARTEKNKAYSLRSFAVNLGLPPSTLSQIMQGKRAPSQKNLEKICAHLGLTIVNEAFTKDSEEPSKETWHNVNTDVFAAISQWYHFAILELIKVHKGKLSPEFISERLGIKTMEARAGLERLERLKLIKKNVRGNWVDLNNGFAAYHDGLRTTEAQKALMGQMLEIAREKIQTVPLEKRDHSSMTLSVRKKDVPKAKELLKKFRREFTALMEEAGEPDEVYELTMAFYPLTKEKK